MSAIARYEADFDQALTNGVKHRSKQVPLEKVIQDGNAFVTKLLKENGVGVRFLPSVNIFVEDHNQAVTLSASGVQSASVPAESCNLRCKSDALDYCFLFEWGGRTLDINGRFQIPAAGQYWKFKTYSTLAGFNNRGEGFGAIFATILKRAMAKLTA